MVPVEPDVYDPALAEPHAREMDFTGRSRYGFAYVDEVGVSEDADLLAWMRRGLEFRKVAPPRFNPRPGCRSGSWRRRIRTRHRRELR